jgi:hypothetical protein
MCVRIAKDVWRRLGLLACIVALAAGTEGCKAGSDEAATPRFVPGWDEARQSLESALSAWRDAPADAPLPASFNTSSVQFIDKQRRPNQRLRSFQILAQTDIENARQFTVRLNLEGEESPQLVKYNILGRAPTWIYRLEDWEIFTHWEHDMDEPAPGAAEKPKAAGRPAQAKKGDPPSPGLRPPSPRRVEGNKKSAGAFLIFPSPRRGEGQGEGSPRWC